MEPMINRTIGERYLIRELRGEGAHARVYRASDGVRKGDVALKLFRPDALDAQVAEAARHFDVRDGTAILPIYEVHPEYIEGEVTVMPLMEKTLADCGPIFASEALHHGRRMLTALEFCHGRDVVHGDVKPSNIFLDERDTTFLGDFGIRDFISGGLRGHTLEYASPELLAGEPRSFSSDTWAMAATLYELLTGELPFGSRDTQGEEVVAQRIATASYTHPDKVRPYLPLSVRNFFRDCFEPDAATRKVRSPDGMRRVLPELRIHAEWIPWRKDGYFQYWEGFQVEGGRKTGVRYVASVRERPRLGRWEAEVKRAAAAGGLRAWPNVGPAQGTRAQAVHRMVLWMRTITGTGRP